eukprot:543994_1
MGNKSSVDENKCIGGGTFKIEQYPLNISEDQWIPTDFQLKSQQNKEVLITKNMDRRVRAEPKDYGDFDDEKIANYNKSDHKNAIYNIVRLKIKYSEHCHKVGTGVIIHHTLNRSYILTAGHNIVELNENDDQKVDYPQAVWAEVNENTENGFKTLNTYNCSEYQVHPKYIKYLKKYGVKESETGYDIAIIEVLDAENKLRKIAPVQIPSYKHKTSDSMKVKVIGYPGEENLRAYEIDTTAGQSGSPIFKVKNVDNSENDEKGCSDNIYQSLGEIVAIHVAGKQKKKLNFGTMLNDEIIEWVHECIDGDCIPYDDCEVGVLLITS